MPEQSGPQGLHPYDVVLKAFEFFKEEKGLEELDLGSLIRICMTANCPTPEIAQGVIANMVDEGILAFRKDEKNNVFFKPIIPDESDLQ